MRRVAFLLPLAMCLLIPACFAQEETSLSPAPQSAAPASQDPTAILAALSQAFSQGKQVSSVALSGTATWTAGSLQDSGTVDLKVLGNGNTKVKLHLGKQGELSEDFSGAGTNQSCNWTDSSQQQHEIESPNCWKPFLWFLPAFTLQPSLLPSSLGVLDLGNSPVGNADTAYRHLYGAYLLDSTKSTQTQQVMKDSSADLGLDSQSSLPAVLAYKLFPEKGADTPIAIEVRYTNYKQISGVEIPFSIQRYINGSLQLDISIQSAQVN